MPNWGVDEAQLNRPATGGLGGEGGLEATEELGLGGAEIGRQHGPHKGQKSDLTHAFSARGPQPTGSPAITRWRARSRAGGTPSNSAAESQWPRLRRRPVAASCSS